MASPSRAYADDPVPYRRFGAEKASVALGGLWSLQTVVGEEAILSAVPEPAGLGGVLKVYERSPVLPFRGSAGSFRGSVQRDD